MIIIYEGKNLEKLCSKLRGKEGAIMTREAYPQPEEAIYYLEKHEDRDIIRSLPRGWAIEMEKFSPKILLEYPERVFTKNFFLPEFLGDLYVSGRIEAIQSLCRYLLHEYRYCIGLSGRGFRLELLKEKTKGRAGEYRGQPLHLHLGYGPREKVHLHLWDGRLEEAHRLKEEYDELPRNHAVLQWGLRGKNFYELDFIQGRYLGKVSKRGYSFQWRKALASF